MIQKTIGALLTGYALLTAGTTHAQEVFFKKGLIANLPSCYGREAVYSDERLDMLHSGASALELTGFYDHNRQIDTANTNYKP